jgi:hypothetical protein
MIVAKAVKLKHVIAALVLGSFLLHSSCDKLEPLPPSVVQCSELLLQSDVDAIPAHAVEQAQRLNRSVHAAVSDREGSILGVFAMTGSVGSPPLPSPRLARQLT